MEFGNVTKDVLNGHLVHVYVRECLCVHSTLIKVILFTNRCNKNNSGNNNNNEKIVNSCSVIQLEIDARRAGLLRVVCDFDY